MTSRPPSLVNASAAQYVARVAKAVLTEARIRTWKPRPDDPGALRVFLYHRISDDPDPLALSPAKFRQQMEYLATNGVRAIDIVTALDRLYAGELEPRTVALTFDDGFRDVLDNAEPVLAEHGFSATVFVSTAVIDGEARYTWAPLDAATPSWAEIRKMDAGGVLRFEPHSRTHPDLRELDDVEARDEIAGSKVELERQLERETHAFCYPAGFYEAREPELVREAGLRYGVTCEPGVNTASTDPYLIHRVQVEATDSLRAFTAKASGSHDRPLPGRARYRRVRYGDRRGSEMELSTREDVVVETVESPEGLEALAPEWDPLVCAMERPSPFLLHGWLAEWWRHYGASGERLAVVTARRQGRLVGAAPLFVGRERGVRTARFLGAHESALADLLLAEDEPASTAQLLREGIQAQSFDYADLFGLPQASLLGQFDGLRVVERVEAPVLLMPDGWEDAYRAKTGSKKRNLHRRRLRQLGELGAVEFAVGRTREELEPMLEEAFRVHNLRWQGRPDGSTFGTEKGRDFHRAALRRLADDDVLRIVLMRIGGRPAAFHYFFELEGTMVVHRLAFDPALARYSPGLVATLETLRVASEDGMTRVEFLGGNERYKLELADQEEPLYEAIGLARNPWGGLAARKQLASLWVRMRLKRSDRLHRLYLGGLGSLRRGQGSDVTASKVG
jgi:CelD/BcsL family acetyltransferase involved in cellulose biosynthesis